MSAIHSLDSPLESGPASEKAILVNLSIGDRVRSRARDVRSGVMVRHRAQAEVVKRVSGSVFEAEHERR
jgi:hypothetical protein